MQKIHLDTKIYPKSVIFSACYSLIDKAYFIFERGANGNIIVNFEEKKKVSNLLGEIKDTLVSYLNNDILSKETKEIRQTILQRALLVENADGK